MKHTSSLYHRTLYASLVFLTTVCLLASGEALTSCQSIRPAYKPRHNAKPGAYGMADKTSANPLPTR